jgi:hypothetical protein
MPRAWPDKDDSHDQHTSERRRSVVRHLPECKEVRHCRQAADWSRAMNGGSFVAATLDRLASKAEEDLEELPRDQWDDYLVDVCRRALDDAAALGAAEHVRVPAHVAKP